MSDYKVGDRVKVTIEGEISHLDGGWIDLPGFTVKPTKPTEPKLKVTVEVLPRPLKVGDKATADFIKSAPEGSLLTDAFKGTFFRAGNKWLNSAGNDVTNFMDVHADRDTIAHLPE